MSQFDDATEKQLRILKFATWLMMVVGPCVYLIIALAMDPTKMQTRAGVEMMFYLILAIGLANLLVVAPIVTRAQIKGFRAGDPSGRSSAQFFMNLSIIQMAFVEAVYIYGLVVFILSARLEYMLYFYPIGIIGSYFYWPRREKYTQLLEKLNQP